ncbi:MAG: hypothetical protein WA839_09355 [Flavobacteriaceae bacterium]
MQNKRILASILFVLISFVCIAQDGKGPPKPQPEAGPPGLPIDGGLLIGAFFAIAYGARKVYVLKK